MSAAALVGIMFVAAIWVVGAYLIWEFGPGERIRNTWCPVLKKRATILADVREAGYPGSYAGLSIVDVKLCSLLHDGMLACHKDCIHPAPPRA